MAANPGLAGMLDGNPRLKQLLTSPDAIQNMLSGAYGEAIVRVITSSLLRAVSPAEQCYCTANIGPRAE